MPVATDVEKCLSDPQTRRNIEKYARRRLPVPDAEDAAQQAMANAWKYRTSFHGGDFQRWILRICQRTVVDIVRTTDIRFEQYSPADAVARGSRSSYTPMIHGKSNRFDLEKAISTLNDADRTVILMAAEGLMVSEIGQMLNIDDVKGRLKIIRRQLRKVLE